MLNFNPIGSMNASQIHSFIANPSLIEASDLTALKEMAQLYPYAESIQLLYLSCVSKHANMYFDDALSSTAFRLSKRERIIALLQENESETNPIQPPVEEQPKVIEQEADSNAVQKEEQTAVAIEFEVAKAEMLTSNSEEETAPEEVPVIAPEPEVDLLEELIYTTTATALEQDYFAGKEIVTSEEETEEAVETEEEPNPGETEVVLKEEEKPADLSSTQLSFTSWLHQNSGSTNEPEKNTVQNTSHPKHTEEIIDRFIEKQPSISKPTAEFYSAPKKAKESLDDSKTPVSETLAKIYVAQGNYPKAIHVYHQLILNNPEKKSLFAPRIEELKNKLS